MHRSGLILSIVYLVVGCAHQQASMNPADKELMMELTIRQLHQDYKDQTRTVTEVVGYYLNQIESLNPQLHAVIAVNMEAMDIAAQMDVSLTEGKQIGPLFGIPILIKDNIETRELPTTAGSLALKNNMTHRDAAVVTQLRAAGAIILGKANLSEWANMRSEHSSSGWSAIGGQTRNPRDTTRTACGSSSGSAVAVAANLSLVAIGTETDGSVICPASRTGIVGLKPSIGLVSQSGIVPISHTQDTAGPMARTVEDAAILLNGMVADDRIDFSAGLTLDALNGKRIGILRSLTGFHEGVDALFDRAIEHLRQAGATIIDDVQIKRPKGFGRDSYDVLLYEFKHNINQYLSNLPGELAELSLESLIAFNQSHQQQEMQYFKQEVFIKAQQKGPLTEQAYIDALATVRRATREEGIDSALESYQLDALIAPTGDPAWKIDLILGDYHGGGGDTSYPAIAGYAHITLPMGDINGLPVGLSFIGGANSDHALLRMAYAFEQHFNRDQ